MSADAAPAELREKADALFNRQYPGLGHGYGTGDELIAELPAGNMRVLQIARRPRGNGHDIVLRLFQRSPGGEAHPLQFGLHFSALLLPAFAAAISKLLDIELAEPRNRVPAPASPADGTPAPSQENGR